jgi:hypothetical protein
MVNHQIWDTVSSEIASQKVIYNRAKILGIRKKDLQAVLQKQLLLTSRKIQVATIIFFCHARQAR